MIIYIAAATENEIQPLMAFLDNTCSSKKKFEYRFKNHRICILIHGIGILNALFHLQNAKKCDLMIQAGIAGSFIKKLKVGTVVNVEMDRLGDLGAEDHDEFRDIQELGLKEINPYYDKKGWLVNTNRSELQNVKAITVNTCSGKQKTIEIRKKKYKCEIESMEGAAFHLYAIKNKISFFQWRAISNFIEPRNKNNWNIPLAVKNLNDYLIQYLQDKHGIKNSH